MSKTNTLTAATQDFARSANVSIDRAADNASEALDTAHAAADQAITKMQYSTKSMVDKTPGLVDLAVERVKDVSQRSKAFAAETTALAKDKAQQVADQTSDRIRQDPLKSVLIAVAAGAALATVASYVAQRRQQR